MDDDIEITGELVGPRGKTWHVIPDFLPDEIFIPKSQCTMIHDEPGSNRVTVRVRRWLAQKENWIV